MKNLSLRFVSNILWASLVVTALVACNGGLNLNDNAGSADVDNAGQGLPPPPSAGWPYLRIGEKFRWTSASGQNIEGTVAEGDLAPSGDCLKGTGRLRLPPHASVDGKWNLGFQLRWQLGSSFRIDAHAEADGNRGLEMLMQRPNSGFKFLVTADAETTDWSAVAGLPALLNKEDVNFSVDIHHDAQHSQFAHLIFFDADGTKVMDSGTDTNGVPGKGHGADLWIILEKVELCGIQFSDPRLGD